MRIIKPVFIGLIALISATSASAVTLDATGRGVYIEDNIFGAVASGNGAGDNYFTGLVPINPPFHGRNWFAYDLSSITGPVTAATFRVFTGTIRLDSSDTPGEFQLHQVASPASDVGTTNGVAIFDDLADGPVYGNFTYGYSDADMTIDITLNASALADINAAIGGTFVMGGHVNNLDFGDTFAQSIFGPTDSNSVSQLILTAPNHSTAVPEPATGLLGLLAIGGMLVRRKTNERIAP